MIRKQRRQTCHGRYAESCCRGGFTLLEIVVVLAVLAILIGITWPVLRGFIAEQEIDQNRLQVWQDISRARIWAIDSGQAYQVRYQPNGKLYIILPYDQPPETAAETAVQATPVLSGELSEYCSFASVNISPSGLSEDLPSTRISDEWLTPFPNAVELAQTTWSSPIVFYPDGSATDVQWALVDQDDRSITFSVRALTGVVSTGKMERISRRGGL